jgi:hypothetical protein
MITSPKLSFFSHLHLVIKRSPTESATSTYQSKMLVSLILKDFRRKKKQMKSPYLRSTKTFLEKQRFG